MLNPVARCGDRIGRLDQFNFTSVVCEETLPGRAMNSAQVGNLVVGGTIITFSEQTADRLPASRSVEVSFVVMRPTLQPVE